jgi:hypothetical protein
MEQWWNEIDRIKRKYDEKKPVSVSLVHHRFHISGPPLTWTNQWTKMEAFRESDFSRF